MASAVRSTALVVTSKPARTFICFATVIEGSLLADQSVHTAHSGGEFRILDIQFDIGWELAEVTVRARVAGPRNVDRAHGGEDRFGAQLPVVR